MNDDGQCSRQFLVIGSWRSSGIERGIGLRGARDSYGLFGCGAIRHRRGTLEDREVQAALRRGQTSAARLRRGGVGAISSGGGAIGSIGAVGGGGGGGDEGGQNGDRARASAERPPELAAEGRDRLGDEAPRERHRVAHRQAHEDAREHQHVPLATRRLARDAEQHPCVIRLEQLHASSHNSLLSSVPVPVPIPNNIPIP